MLSKPKSPPSLGSSSARSASTPSKSRTAFAYSARLSRCTVVAPRVRLLRGRGIQRAHESSDEFRARFRVRLRLVAGWHCPDRQLVDDLFPDRGIGVHVVESSALERKIRCELCVVVTLRAVLADHGPLLLELSFRRSARQEIGRNTDSNNSDTGDVNPSFHCAAPSEAFA